MKNKWLYIVFIGLLAVYFISQVVYKKPTQSFNPDFIDLNTEQVNKITIHSKGGQAEPFTLARTGESWRVSSEGLTADAQSEPVNTLLNGVKEMKAERVVAKNREKWSTFELEEEQGKRIQFFDGEKLLEEIVLGKFDFNQEARTAKSYVRHKDDDNVYVVDGFLSMSLGGDMNSFRNKVIAELDINDITGINITSNGSTRSLRKENYWVDETNQMVDTVAIDNYLNALTNINGTSFEDNFNASNANKIATLSIQKTSTTDPLVISVYEYEQGSNQFYIHSSANPEAYFASDSAGIFKRLFLDF